MKPSKIVLQWLKYARTDLNLAKASLELSSTYKAVSAFHSQQCAEKAIKAYLTFKKVRFPKTHDLELLVKEIDKIDPVLAKKIVKAKTLTNYAVTYRYPDAERKPLTIAKSKAATKLAEHVLDLCIQAIKA